MYCQAAAVAEAGVSRQAAMAIASRLEVLEGASLQQLGIGVPRAHWTRLDRVCDAITGWV